MQIKIYQLQPIDEGLDKLLSHIRFFRVLGVVGFRC